MLVSDAMSRDVHYCEPHERASAAARAMWNHDVGCLPIVDTAMRPIGMVTDRDLCMAMLHAAKPLHQVHIAEVMSHAAYTCHPSDPVTKAAQTMRMQQVRRLMVIGDDGKLVGILSLNDIIPASRSPLARPRERLRGEVGQTLEDVSRRRRVPGGARF